MANIFFDLDGTIINSQHRMYNLFIELCPECKMSYKKYWEIKRQRISQKDFLKKYFDYNEKKCIDFHKKWLEKVEEPQRLKQDFLVEGILEVIKNLSQKYTLYVVTNRQSKEYVFFELEKLNIKKYFKNIFTTEQKKKKEELIKENISFSKDDFLIGDTGEDIKCAKALGIKSCAVSWGILNESILKEYCPDIIIKEVRELESQFI